MKTQSVVVYILALTVIVGGAIYFNRGRDSRVINVSDQTESNNVELVDGLQVVTITAKGGYSPRRTVAKADIPTVIRIKTNGTFDCSSAVSVPVLGFRKNLPPSGETEIEVPVQKAGSAIQGVCAMGMYYFQILFS